jgi:hypothetical protein
VNIRLFMHTYAFALKNLLFNMNRQKLMIKRHDQL